MKDNFVIYQNQNGDIELRADLEKDTIWASQEQISKLFEVSIPNVSMHLKNIFLEGELSEISVIKDFLTTGSDAKKYKIKNYNLDAIIAVGYRVNSKKATQFRIWATGILSAYLKRGFAFNKYKLDKSPEALVDLYDAVTFLESSSPGGKLKAKITLKMTKDFVSRS